MWQCQNNNKYKIELRLQGKTIFIQSHSVVSINPGSNSPTPNPWHLSFYVSDEKEKDYEMGLTTRIPKQQTQNNG